MYGVCYCYVGEDLVLDVMYDGFVKVFFVIGQLYVIDLYGFRFWIICIMVIIFLYYFCKQKSSFFFFVDDLEENM